MEKAYENERRNLEREMKLLQKLDDPNLDVDTLKSTLGLIKEDTIYVSNLPFSTTEKDLRELFVDCGKILSVRMPENRQTKQNRGFAFITFENEKGCRKALNYDGHSFYERKLKISKAEKKADIEEKRLKGEDVKKEWKKNPEKYEEEVKKDLRNRHERGKRYRSRSRSNDRKRRRHSHDRDSRKRKDDSRDRKKKYHKKHSESRESSKGRRSRSKSPSESSSSSSSDSSASSGFEDNQGNS